jgi:hypothetical protein
MNIHARAASGRNPDKYSRSAPPRHDFGLKSPIWMTILATAGSVDPGVEMA